jgi:hypothetical protein
MFKVLKWLTWRFNTLDKGAWKDLQDDTRGFNVTSRIYLIRKDQHKWVIAIELKRIRSRWCWLSTPLLKIKMHWWGDDYVIVQSWCTRYGVMRHVAMQCSQSYGTNSLNPWVMPSNFSELSKDVWYWKKGYRNALLEMVNHHDFDRGRKMWRNLMTITQPLTMKTLIGRQGWWLLCQIRKDRKFIKRGNFVTSLINGLGDARLQVRLTILHKSSGEKRSAIKDTLSKEGVWDFIL